MYTLTPETLIRIEDASDPKRGFILIPWEDLVWQVTNAQATMFRSKGSVCFKGFKFLHPDAITEVE